MAIPIPRSKTFSGPSERSMPSTFWPQLPVSTMSHTLASADDAWFPEYIPPGQSLCFCLGSSKYCVNSIRSTWELGRDADSQANLTPAGSETLKVRPSNLCFNMPSRWFWCMLTFSNRKCPFVLSLLKCSPSFEDCLNTTFSMRLSLILCSAPTAFSCVFLVSFSMSFLVCQSYAYVRSPLVDSKLKDRELMYVPLCVCVCVWVCVCVFCFALSYYFVICFLFFKNRIESSE